ncbi:MAG: FAD-binding oxidoreductase [Chloroflexota bacterium]
MADPGQSGSSAGGAGISERQIGDLANRMRGSLLRAGDAGYEEARRVWNGTIDKRPALIARCATPDDVVAAVNFARDNALALAVRGGGHNVAGYGTTDGGLVIDLSPMRAVAVDAGARRARVQGGATWADLDGAAQQHGLATPGGLISDTGVAGLTLGGGLGWLRRKFGLSCDNVRSVEIVTADGQLRRASTAENPDLFWALRGGGGNFGVVTEFEFELYPVGPEVAVAIVVYPVAATREVLRRFRDWTRDAPDEMAALAFPGVASEDEPFPEPIRGQPMVMVVAPYIGPVPEGEAALRPLRELAEPLADLSGVLPWVELQRFLDEEFPRGRLYYWKSVYLDDFSEEAIALIDEHARRAPSPLSTVDVWQLGGAMSRVDPSSTAFGRRDAPFMIGVEANWDDPAQSEQNIAWARACVKDLEPFSRGGLYLNFPGLMEEGDRMLQGTFGDSYQRLRQIKTKYDPHNLFRLNQNVKPLGQSVGP